MARQLQLRRGTTAENDAFTGAEGEITVDTQRKELRIHDGQTPGGMRTITLNPGDIPPDNGVDYIVESNHYTNYTDPYGNVCANYYIDIYKSGKTHIEADGVSNSSKSNCAVRYIKTRNNNCTQYGKNIEYENTTVYFAIPYASTNDYSLVGQGFVIANYGRQSISYYNDRFTVGSAAQNCGSNGWVAYGKIAS